MDSSLGSEPARSSCSPLVDAAFGPVVDHCARTFDFTLLFEETILSILPSSVFLFLALVRIAVLSARKRRTGGSLRRTIKLTIFGILLALCATLVALWSLAGSASPTTRTSVPAAVLSMVECVVFMVLSYLEHTNSVGSPLLLDAYLFISILFDAVRVRTLWLNHTQVSIFALFTVCLGIKIAILILEESSKRQWLLPSPRPWSTEITGGIFSRTLFVWLDKMMWKGYATALSVVTLPDIDADLLSNSLWERIGPQLDNATGSSASLLVTVFWTLKGPLLAPVFPYLVLVASQLAQPFLISTILDYVGSPFDGSEDQKNTGYGLIGAYGLVYLCIAISTAWGQHLSYRFVVMLRGILVTSIYRKTMSMSLSVAGDASAVTLMSTDVERIVLGMAKIHDSWSTLVQVACAMYILYQQVGAVFIAPVVLSIVCTFGSLVLSSFAGTFQVKWMSALEKRIAITSSLIGSIKGVKMLGWSRKVSELIHQLRLAEIASARNFRLMLLAVVTTSFIPVTMAPVATFGIFVSQSHKEAVPALGSSRIFTTLSLLSLITQPLDLLFAYVPEIIAAIACFSRIQVYLYQKTQFDVGTYFNSTSGKSSSYTRTTNDSSVGSDSDEINEKALPPDTAILLRDVELGWNSDADAVLQSLDSRIPSHKLTIITGPIASGKSTLLKGILGETPVIRGTIQLSSQSIAFCDQNPWLANETLRANVLGSNHFDAIWYSQVIKACALEEDIARFAVGDQVIVGSNGLSLSGGQKQRLAIARAVYSRRAIALFDDVFSGLDMETQSRVMHDVFGPGGLLKANGITAILVTHATQLLAQADWIIALDSKGRLLKQGPPEKFTDRNKNFSELQSIVSASEQTLENAANQKISELEPSKPVAPLGEKSVDPETQRLGDGSVYKYYFSTFGWPKTIVFFALEITLVFCIKFPEIILSWWGESNDTEPNMHNGKWLGIFTALEFAALVSLVLICWAPLFFFSSTDTGSITNRFSQDINLIDAELPFSLINFVCNGLTCVAQAFMIIPASAWLLIGYPILFGGLWLLQRFYLRTSRQLRFLDLDAKSPIYAQFLETLNGLATIRAFGWQGDLIAKADERLDYSQKPFYLLYSIQRWLNLVLDLIVACLAVVLIAVAVSLRNSTSVGFAGVALFNIMNLSAALKSAITSWTMLETSIGAVARVKRYEESTPEEDMADEDQHPSASWPASGAMIFEDVTASYKDGDDQTALSGISLRINHGEKIGICGRSGSGKSSLLLALLHLINFKGSITIDGHNISRIPRETLRERLTAVPQDPVFLSGTVRLNSDPHRLSSDESIVQALRAVKLWDVIEAKGGLDAQVNDELFSKGQQQLFSLARALLNHSKIVVMDEASSSLDAQSEELMMSIVKDKFEHATVLSVAHRLDTIADFDRVLVLDSGKVIEQGNPRDLLTRPSAFRSLYESPMHVPQNKD
ncbi:hypothetical protein SUNI508_02151 [Seiridium unicorne]|uniref:ABC transporter n=1 Tax=Seiridium unicorne TaxID=138068 RepID=A0ABR2ULE2_9PEZI